MMNHFVLWSLVNEKTFGTIWILFNGSKKIKKSFSTNSIKKIKYNALEKNEKKPLLFTNSNYLNTFISLTRQILVSTDISL